ncbi:BlaI/MecI/CopY family transcriptional regulator [Mycolicibacterium chubuense]|uniref:BlaI/MecI/CopY family transcriptional regulator n=1 Tax=Mycolicibacterium chubuense TaxID=1800 RepID=UPI0013013081|nr:BlaI/MecI/CopY family transcriptional regulator [Mycolicibacterium chubuense]
MRREPGALEEAVVGVLSADESMTVAQVRAVLGGELAHTTVMTALVRLTDKGLVRRVRVGRSYAYSLVAVADDLPALRAALRMRRELDSRDERAEVLANFVARLEPDDEAVLRRLLDASDGDRRG